MKNRNVYKLGFILKVMKIKRGLSMKNKGLSNLVATVLIVLLALAAVAIVWGFVRPTLDRSGTEIDLQTKCISADVTPVRCTYSNIVDQDSKHLVDIEVVARQESDTENMDITMLVDDSEGATVASETADAPGVLSTLKFDASTTGGNWNDVAVFAASEEVEDQSDYEGVLTRLTVAPVVGDGTGETKTCAGKTVSCTYVPDCGPYALDLCDNDQDCAAAGGTWDDPVCEEE